MRLEQILRAARRSGNLEIVDRSRGSAGGTGVDIAQVLQAAPQAVQVTDGAGSFYFMLGLSELGEGDLLAVAPSPRSLPGLVLWLDAAQVDLDDGDPVSTWVDASYLVNNAVAISGPTWDEDAGDGWPAVALDGIDDGFDIAGITLDPDAETFTVAIVHRTAQDTGTQTLLSQTTSGSGLLLLDEDYGNNWGGSAVYTGSSYTAGDWRLVLLEWNGAQVRFRIDGSEDGEYARAPAASSSAWRIGLDPSSANPLAGALREIVICSPALLEEHRDVLERYLMQRWRL